jgi:hypothetical protein
VNPNSNSQPCQVPKEGLEPSRPKTPRLKLGASANSTIPAKCPWSDSNRHPRRDQALNLARLPITPHGLMGSVPVPPLGACATKLFIEYSQRVQWEQSHPTLFKSEIVFL